MVNYMAKLIPELSAAGQPLYELLKVTAEWTCTANLPQHLHLHSPPLIDGIHPVQSFGDDQTQRGCTYKPTEERDIDANSITFQTTAKSGYKPV